MILGIGVDDMFVIVNSVDQQPWWLSADERFKRGFIHAGPSITITSVTGALAFFFGAVSPTPALRSFCMFAGICVCSLYFCFITIFSAFFVIDLRR
jgi:predicted RND superfamily exporter protein